MLYNVHIYSTKTLVDISCRFNDNSPNAQSTLTAHSQGHVLHTFINGNLVGKPQPDDPIFLDRRKASFFAIELTDPFGYRLGYYINITLGYNAHFFFYLEYVVHHLLTLSFILQFELLTLIYTCF